MPPDESAKLVPWAALDASTIRRFPDPALDWFASHPWFDLVARAAVPPGLQPGCVVNADGVVPVWCRGDVLIAGQSSPYALEFTPVLPIDPTGAGRAGKAFGLIARHRATVRLDGLDPAQPGLEAFLAGVAIAGLVVQRFNHFGDWLAPVTTDDFDRWLATRPGALRNTVVRKLKRARSTTNFQWIAADPALAAGIADFELVYAASWKQPEPFPDFNPACMRALAEAGLLRLGILSTATGPIAAQYWAVSGGRAMLLKLAHDEAAASLSPGTVLTARMIEAILRHDRPTMLDFGRGDDPYKRLWVDQRRERIGALLINPRHPAGLAQLARGAAGALRRRFKQDAA
ncbi:MAG: GNAT family N-acetyltransferase [Acidiphilium sp.]|nr:GNAT family N-acetyltransferase [Acidiphilium sp.]MDD4936329.1 GNAT family N-acetyltransferase [Acidiphilium sp.]